MMRNTLTITDAPELPHLPPRWDPWLMLFLGCALVTIPLFYFFNGLVTEYYYSKAFWANLFVPIPLMVYFYFQLRSESCAIPRGTTVIPLALLIFWSLLSLFWSPNIWKGIELILKVGAGPFAWLAIPLFFRTLDRIRALFYMILFSMFAVCVYGFVQYFEVTYLPRDQYGEADPSTTIGLTNFVMDFMITFIPVAPAFFLIERRSWVRLLLLISFTSTIFYAIIARNRAAFLGMLTEILVLFLVLGVVLWKYREQLGITPARVGLVTLAIVGSLTLLFTQTVIGRRMVDRFTIFFGTYDPEKEANMNLLERMIFRAEERDFSTKFRVETWKQCIQKMFPERPIVGNGLANAEVLFPLYFTPFLEDMTLKNNTRVVQLHNEYVQALTDLGIVGFLLLMLVLAAIIYNAYRTLTIAASLEQFLFWIAVNLGFFGYFVHMFFTFPLQIPTSGNFFFVALGIQEAFRRVIDPKHKPYWLIPMTPGFKAAGCVCFSFAIASLLFLNFFTYNALYAEVRNKEARIYKQYQRWNEAYALLTDSIEHYPYMEGYYYDRAVVLMQMGKKREALEDLRQTAHLVPNYAMGRKQIGFLARELGMPELAVQEFRKTMEIYRIMRLEITELIAETALAYGKPELAIPTLEETLKMGITTPTLVQSLADAYLLQGSYSQAISQYEVLREMGKWDPDVRVRYAHALSLAGDVTRAEAEVKNILSAHEDHAESWFVMGKLDLLKGNTRAAVESFTRAIALDPKVRAKMLLDPTIKGNKEIMNWLKQS